MKNTKEPNRPKSKYTPFERLALKLFLDWFFWVGEEYGQSRVHKK